MKTKNIITIIVVLFLASLSVHAEVLTFDDIGTTPIDSLLIPDGYGGFDWDYFYYMNAFELWPNSGYNNGLVSGEYVAHNSGYFNTVGINGNTFDFEGVYLTAGWRDGLNVQVDGYLNSSLIYSTTVIVDTTAPTWCQFDYEHINELRFCSYGGTPNPNYSPQDGYHFAMDNFTYIPEPAALLLFTFGGLLLRRTRK